MSRMHEMLLADGRFAGTSRADLKASFAAFAASPHRGALALHFHGGLVPERVGHEVAEKLTARYRDDGQAWPIFPVWRSGALETLRYNWDEIVQEEVFPLLVERLTRFVLGKLDQDPGDKGTQIERPPLAEVRAAIAAATAQGAEPFRDREPELERLDETLRESERAQLEGQLKADAVLLRAADRLARPDGPRLADPLQAQADLARTQAADGDKAIVSAAMLAAAGTRILGRTLRRLAQGRGHGVYTTVVEESARELKGDLIGGILWKNMKRDCADAFAGPPETHGGTALLESIAGEWRNGHRHRVVLIGHSTGAVWIAELLKAAARMPHLPAELRFEIVLLAPASTFDLLDAALRAAPGRLAGFRVFGMRDERERRDRLIRPVPFLYPRSLLYFVSGVAEEQTDMPLVGMERYHGEVPPYDAARMPAIASVRERVRAFSHPWVWSPADAGPGVRTSAASHGGFDDDADTLDSIVHLLRHGL